MKKLFSLTMLAMIASFASHATITGTTALCLGTTGYVADSLNAGGTWSSSNTAIATINTTSGTIYPVAAGGPITLTYFIPGGGTETSSLTVSASPAPITGASSFCVGSSSTVADATSGGTWSIDAYYATISSTGLVTGVNPGYPYIYYTMPGGCYAVAMDTIGGNYPGYLSGASTICLGSTSTLVDSSSMFVAGTWSSNNTSIATVSSTGVVTGVTVGYAVISYAVPGVCGTTYDTMTVNVSNTSSAGTIGVSGALTVGGTSYMYSTVSGGTWSSSNTAVATVDPATGYLTGLLAGNTTITYTVSGCGGVATGTYNVVVTDIDGIAGHINFAGTGYNGPVKVWLITYDAATSDLEAVDSTEVYCSGSSVNYQFLGSPTANYRVKAAADDSGLTTGYQPTYHTASFYWNTANIVNHTTGTADYNEDINMAYGTVTSGPGFIGGNVTTGANKNTSGIPVAGLKMNVVNTATNALMQSIRTDAAGHYSFSNLPVGNYYVLPDSLNFVATNYTNIAITTAQPTVSAASFVQHTISKTITPVTEAVSNLNGNVTSVFAFPNPASSKLNLQWTLNATETANVSITDITGREMYTAAINMTQGTGVKQIDLSAFINGLYVISVKSATVNYNSKIQVQH